MASDGYCQECAELQGQEPTLVVTVLEWRTREPDRRSFSAWCTGCGATTVDRVGGCLGHNHEVDLRRLRQHAVTVHHRLRHLNQRAASDAAGAVEALHRLLATAGYSSLASACRLASKVTSESRGQG